MNYYAKDTKTRCGKMGHIFKKKNVEIDVVNSSYSLTVFDDLLNTYLIVP